jgi:hypothetical protein
MVGIAVLRARRERPGGSAAEQRDEIATLHSITSLAGSRQAPHLTGLTCDAYI